MDHAPALPHQRLAALDERLAGAAARPVALPETIVVDRGKVFVSAAFTAACEHLGISVQPAPPRAPTAKGIVERTFGTPLTGRDYLELLPVRWQAITPAGITIHHRTYDHDLLAPYRGQASPVAGRGGKWEIHYNPHDVRQIWIRLTDNQLTEIPWIQRDHVHQPFNDPTWQHIRTHTQHNNHDDSQQHEAHVADALDPLMRRVHTGHATKTEQALLARATTLPDPTTRHPHHNTGPLTDEPAKHDENDEDDSIDDLDDLPDDDTLPATATGFGLYDAHEEADKW